ncbi:MAG: hypothetical protein H8E44_39470 [Planctomycetes bacterium]|nr:hypothetical protein [Planctomycetota bacterium]MBL7040978.1 hypothetical protein [Pirellulaceae bacterium]
MAQYIPSFPFFYSYWEPRLELAGRVLLDAQNCWLLTDNAFPVDKAAAAILWIFAFDFPAAGRLGYRGITRKELYARRFDDWCQAMGTAAEECTRLLPLRSSADREFAVDAVSSILFDASREWENDPSSPTPKSVARQCADFLATNRFVRLHAPDARPT